MTTINPVVHFEMPAENSKRMAEFYTKAFGWKANHLGEEMGGYVTVATGETDADGFPKNRGMINGGFYEKTEEMPMQYPSVVISVQDIERHMQIVRDAGGTVLGEPMEIPGVGKYVAFVDTEGNRVSMLQSSEMQ